MFAQIVAVAPALESAGEVTRVTAYTSDLIELVSGVPPVSLADPLSETCCTGSLFQQPWF